MYQPISFSLRVIILSTRSVLLLIQETPPSPPPSTWRQYKEQRWPTFLESLYTSKTPGVSGAYYSRNDGQRRGVSEPRTLPSPWGPVLLSYLPPHFPILRLTSFLGLPYTGLFLPCQTSPQSVSEFAMFPSPGHPAKALLPNPESQAVTTPGA